MGGADGEVGGRRVARREGEGRGGQDGANGRGGQTGVGRQTGLEGCQTRRGVARRDWDVAKRGGGVSDGDFWGPDGMGGCPNGKDVGDGWRGCLNRGEG
jgi:hypothetical protein